MCKNSAPTSRKTTKRLYYKEKMLNSLKGNYHGLFENHIKPLNTFRLQNSDLTNVKVGSTYRYQSVTTSHVSRYLASVFSCLNCHTVSSSDSTNIPQES